MASTVKTERRGRVMWVRLDNPPRNFMTGQMVRELDQLTRELEDDPAIGTVVITGEPDGIFITHFDVEEIVAGAEASPTVAPAVAGGTMRAVGALARMPGVEGALEGSPVTGLLELRRIHELFLRMNRMDKVFVAAINGLALGGGCELALACDIRLMAEGEGHRIGLPEMTLGIIPGAGGTQRMTRALGTAQALELMLEARPLTPGEAEEVGLVHRAVPAARLEEEAAAVAERLARRSPLAVRELKHAVYEGGSRSLPAGLHAERAGFLAAAASEPAMRAMRAYVEQVREIAPGERAPWAQEEFLAPWREGTAVDLTA